MNVHHVGDGWRVWTLYAERPEDIGKCFIQQPDGALAVGPDGKHIVAESRAQAEAAVRMMNG
jgi:hypothetical protein